MKKKIKLLFQGDSITDAGRDKRNYHDMGKGYPKYAAELMAAAHPEIEFEFINFGISGNRRSPTQPAPPREGGISPAS